MAKLTNRLSPPVLPDSVMERPEVNSAIDDAIRKDLVFIHAPAGYGKTIAMSMWLSSRRLSAAWIPLTVYDDEPVVFCRYLLLALAEFYSGAAEPAKAALSDPGFPDAPFEFFFRAVSLLSGGAANGVVVFDDFHVIENTTILNTLPTVIRKLSQLNKIVILSRLEPPVSLYDLALKNQIGELKKDDLRFTKRQIMRLYNSFGVVLNAAEATDIEEKTGGWALGLGAELLSIKFRGSESFLSQASGEKYINGYLKREFWDKWGKGTQEFLLKTSILEDLTPELCDRLSHCDSKKVLARLMSNSGMAVRLPDGSFRYHHILRDFLRWMANVQGTDLSGLYIAAAEYMQEQGNSNAALDYAVKSGDFNVITRVLYRIVGYETTIRSVEEFCNSIFNSVLKIIPAGILESNVYALTPCTLASNLNGNLDLFNHWRSIIKTHLEHEKNVDLWLLTGIWLYEFVTPQNSFRDILKLAPSGLSGLAFENLPSPVVTCNFPYIHRSHRDYSDFADDWEELVPAFISTFNAISGNIVFILVIGLECGILYEQNKLGQAKEKAVELLGWVDDNQHTELLFSAYMHLAAIEFAESDEAGAWDTMRKAQAVVERDGLYLLKNLNAVTTKYRLYKGDRGAAGDWLSHYAADDGEPMKFYQIYQALTTIRARIALGEFNAALMTLAKLEKLATDYRRPLDQIEIHILRSLAQWMQKQRADAVDSMEKAMLMARPYGFTRIFANEGAAAVPILQKLYNRYSGKQNSMETTIFARTLLLMANESAALVPGITNAREDANVKLSKQQMRMLLFLAAGKNNRQICEETGLKLNTVKAHLYKLYEKLEVNSAIDAVVKSRQLGVIEAPHRTPQNKVTKNTPPD